MTTGLFPLRGRPGASATGWPRRVSAGTAALAVLVLAACTLGEGPPPASPPAPAPVELEGPALGDAATEVSAERVREATRLVSEAERALGTENFSVALDYALRIEDEFADVPGTARALRIQASAHRGMGAGDRAEAAAARYLERFPEGDPGRPEAALFLAETRVEVGHPGDVDALFATPTDAPAEVQAGVEALSVRVARDLDLSSLREIAARAPDHPAVLPAFLVELAVRRALMSDQEEGRELANRALELDPGSELAERARYVAEGRMDQLERDVVVLGALLSEGGPPSLRQLSADIRDGIEVALAEAEETGTAVRFEILDDQGSESRAAELVARLESAGVTAMIGPLIDPAVAAAARARRGGAPMVSPTARLVPAAPGVMSLTGVDPSASRALAQAALSSGVQDVVIIHPRTPEMEEEAAHFRRAFEEAGGRVRQTVTYAPGTTSFQGPFQEVIRTRPAGLALILPPDDVDMVAPQVAYYGVDDLLITILGNEAWSSENVLQSVPTRHTEGVITVSSRAEDGFGPRWSTFVERYESHFQRTLRSPASALGYDAARLLLFAASQGDGSAEGTARALETIREFPGATGILEVVDGRIQRSYRPVRIEGGRAVPLQR